MNDKTDLMSNICTDLVSLRRLEPGVIHLLRDRKPGAWTHVRDLYERAEEESTSMTTDLLAAWLPSPNDPDYAVIVFFDDETKWSLTAEYNAKRLLGQQAPAQVAVAG